MFLLLQVFGNGAEQMEPLASSGGVVVVSETVDVFLCCFIFFLTGERGELRNVTFRSHDGSEKSGMWE